MNIETVARAANTFDAREVERRRQPPMGRRYALSADRYLQAWQVAGTADLAAYSVEAGYAVAAITEPSDASKIAGDESGNLDKQVGLHTSRPADLAGMLQAIQLTTPETSRSM